MLRKMWLIGSRSSRWAGRKMIELSRNAAERDALNSPENANSADTADDGTENL